MDRTRAASEAPQAVLTRELEDVACAHVKELRTQFPASPRRLHGQQSAKQTTSVEDQMPKPRIHPIADRIHPIAYGMNAMPDGMSLVWRTMNPIVDGMNAMPDGMSLVWRTINPIAHGMNAIVHGMNLIWRTANPIRGHF